MLVYKSKLQLYLCKFNVDDILLANDKNTPLLRGITSRSMIANTMKSCLDNFSEEYGRPLGNSSIMSKVFMVYGLLITVIYLATVLNGYGVPSLFETSFKPYDYVNMVTLTIFIGFNVLYAHYTMINFSDSFRFTGEVLTVSCLIVVGFLVYWLVLRGAEYTQGHPAIAFFALIGTSLLILLTIDWNLYKARVWSCPRSPSNLMIDDILGISSICKQFEEHLTKEYSLENLNFLKTCERYHELLLQSDIWSISSVETEYKFSMDIPSRKSSMARYIYEQFCVRNAPQEINLSREIIRKLRDHFENYDSPFTAEIFDDAIECIKDLLANDTLRRFKVDTGDLYARL